MRDFVTGDDPVFCNLCGKETSLAMIARHLEDAHGLEDIANAEVVMVDDDE